jgi:aldehyde dehydrogenase (NAD+)
MHDHTIDIETLLPEQRRFFATGQTRDLQFRLTQLSKLQTAIIANQDQIVAAVQADLGRAPFEAYFEIAVLKDIQLAIKQLKNWTKPRKMPAVIEVFPAKAWIEPQPLGVALIIGAWNYPFDLIISPLVGAIAAGNCAILKPSEHSPHTATVIADLIRSIFDPSYVAVIIGDAQVGQRLLQSKFDHIFFTGSTNVGKMVMAAAAQYLTSVTLEMGGKSPCIVDRSARLDIAAKRIAWGKFINAGQTCLAPDYLLVDRRIKSEFMACLITAIQELYGEDPAKNPDFGRIVNQQQFDRLTSLLTSGKVVLGGQSNAPERYLAPTVLDEVGWDDLVMAEEIFGPILPVLTYDQLDEVIREIVDRPKPLALYIFAQDESVQSQILAATSSGSVCINDTVMQWTIPNLPFGGVGDSGIGSYHGKASFDTFSHYRGVLKRSMFLDLKWRYAPYTSAGLRQIKKIVTGQ